MDLTTITENGLAIREGNKVRILVKGHGDDSDILELKDSSITCLNPDAAEDERVYEKIFAHREIYLSSEEKLAVDRYLKGGVKSIAIFGANGLSSIKDINLKAWHISHDKYRIAVETTLEVAYLRMREELGEGVDIRFVHGCSTQGTAERGVDMAIINVATRLRCQMLGFSCPRYMMYVTDETDFPVLVCVNKDAYSEKFVENLDVLITCNGRVQTLEMDIKAAIFKRKFVVLYDLLSVISPTGGPPAYGPNDEIEDAVKALISGMFMVGGNLHIISKSGDPWKDDLLRISQAIITRCRTHVLDSKEALRIKL